jgi:hypothetical protein
MFAGLVSGVCGAFVCNPFELVKTRLQAQVVEIAAADAKRTTYR